MPDSETAKQWTITLADAAATARLGAAIAKALKPGHLVALSGGLGAGKTALARAVVRALCNDAELEVPSPSFALVQPYDREEGPILHADLYRLEHDIDLEELGLFDDPTAIVLVEWAERVPQIAAEAELFITLEAIPGRDGRLAHLVSRSDDEALAKALAHLSSTKDAPHD